MLKARNSAAMLQTLSRLFVVNTIKVQPYRNASTFMGVRSLRDIYGVWLDFWYRYIYEGAKLRPPPVAPYKHVCQVGDPILRERATQVKVEDITTREFQKIISSMREIMERQCLLGLSASQIGLPWQVFVMGFNNRNVRRLGADVSIWEHEEPVPFTVFINPHKLTITDKQIVKAQEGCGSIVGYCANVPRYQGVQITAYDEKGKLVVRKASGLAARIIQHEMDHLQGKLFTDSMDASTFHCAFWSVVNSSRGKASIKFKV